MTPTPTRQSPEYQAVVAAMTKRCRCRFNDLVVATKLSQRVVSHMVNLMLGAGVIEVDTTSSEYVVVKGG